MHPRRQAGVGIVTAVFLLVVLAGLGVAMVSLYTAQQAASSLDLAGARAYQAARAGLEWGMFRQMRNDSCAPRTRVAMPAGSTLAGFTVIVRCAGSGAGSGLARFRIVSVACNMPDSQGGCNCDGGGACAPSRHPESVSRGLEVQL